MKLLYRHRLLQSQIVVDLFLCIASRCKFLDILDHGKVVQAIGIVVFRLDRDLGIFPICSVAASSRTQLREPFLI